MKGKEIAERINVYLERFEKDPVINEAILKRGGMRFPPYYSAYAVFNGKTVEVTYLSYQGSSNLTKAEAKQYLIALDNGFIGTHFGIKEIK